MALKRSFIVRLFCALFVALMVILLAAGGSIYLYSQQVVGQEFLRLNQASLHQLAASIGRSLSDIRGFGERIAGNGRLIQLLAQPGAPGQKEARSLVSDLMNEYVTSRGSANALMEVCVLGYNGLAASSYSSNAFTLEALRADERYAPLFEQGQPVMLPTAYNPEGRGVLMYTFQMAWPVEDLFTGEACGVLVIDVSELILYSSLRGYQQNNVELNMIDGESRVLAGRDKTRIGAAYPYPREELEALSRQTLISRRTLEEQFYLYERVPGTEWLLVQKLPAATAFEPLAQVRNAILLITLSFGLLVLGVLVYAARRVLRPVLRIRDKMETVMAGDLTARIEGPLRKDEFGQIEQSFNGMVEKISLLIEAVKSEEKQKRLAELDFLQAQINPHFIYNTLTSVRFKLEMGKTEEAADMVFYFSKLLRQTLSRSDEFIPLRDELAALENYASLQKLRYTDSFEMTIDVPAEVLDVTVPALMLQPVVENAIFHGVGQGNITIRVTGETRPGLLVLHVADNGIGMSRELRENVLEKDVQVNRVGLRNVHDRIRLNYGREYGLGISETPGGGTTISFLLPYGGPAPQTGEEAPA